jgi:hypothetical protein
MVYSYCKANLLDTSLVKVEDDGSGVNGVKAEGEHMEVDSVTDVEDVSNAMVWYVILGGLA